MKQPSEIIIQAAISASLKSPCRSKRGVVIFRHHRVESTGFNYKPLPFECDSSERCKETCGEEAVHAEEAALLNGMGVELYGADLLHVKTVNGKLVPSGGPSCVKCSRLILHCMLKHVWLYHEDGWRSYEAVEFHRLSLEAHRAKKAALVKAG